MQNKKFAIFLAFVLSFSFTLSRGQSAEAILAYITRYKDLAIAEMKRTGVPAAITLAQGIHETEAGTSVLVKKSNNHFGIKCKDEWRGQSVSHDDDARGECFRKYSAAEDSYRDHSDFLRNRPNYTSLFTLDPTDYQGWAYGLKKAGYATNPKYAQVLIKLIQDYNLEDYTLIAMGKMKDGNDLAKNDLAKNPETSGDKNSSVVLVKNNDGEKGSGDKNKKEEQKMYAAEPAGNIVSYPSGEFKINDTRVIYVKKGTSYLTIAQQYEIPLARLFEFNDLKQEEVTADDQLVFIQRKRKTGDHEFHTVQPGETVNVIAQSEAIRLESLLEYNNMTATMQPAAGETLYLHSKSAVTPRLVTKTSTAEKFNSGTQAVAMNGDGKGKKELQQKNNFIFHTVEPKETVYSIAKKFNVSADDLISWNQLQDNDLKIGQSLKIYR
ncbi:MAG TPA: glucosaminidase domain-containing protein [Chitinophagaceae bacterium]|jgi:LysM repeat protein|nr:glucosaminidase domain-containing protein [Chitinophagaceae bacterium]